MQASDQQSPQCRKEKASKKIINLPPPLIPSSCSTWGRRRNLTWVRFRTISFPHFDEQAFISTSYVRTRQAGNKYMHVQMWQLIRQRKKKENLLKDERKSQEITGSRRKTLELKYASMCHCLLEKRRNQNLDRKRTKARNAVSQDFQDE